MSRGGMPRAEFRRLLWTRIVPAGAVLGASIETFMYFTGFWSVATRKEGERRLEAEQRRADQRTLPLTPAGLPQTPPFPLLPPPAADSGGARLSA